MGEEMQADSFCRSGRDIGIDDAAGLRQIGIMICRGFQLGWRIEVKMAGLTFRAWGIRPFCPISPQQIR